MRHKNVIISISLLTYSFVVFQEHLESLYGGLSWTLFQVVNRQQIASQKPPIIILMPRWTLMQRQMKMERKGQFLEEKTAFILTNSPLKTLGLLLSNPVIWVHSSFWTCHWFLEPKKYFDMLLPQCWILFKKGIRKGRMKERNHIMLWIQKKQMHCYSNTA